LGYDGTHAFDLTFEHRVAKLRALAALPNDPPSRVRVAM
jgi:hypothetical protein